MTAAPAVADLFTHVRIVMGMVIGLGITRVLAGVAGLIQHPSRARVSVLHLLWTFSILIELILYWWWEFGLAQVTDWSFGTFVFIIAYSIALFLLATLLFPERIDDYEGWEHFFLKRRRWFFGVLALTFVFDVIDTVIRGEDFYAELTLSYLVQVPIGVALCVIGMLSANRRVHYGLVLVQLAYQLWWSSVLFRMHV